MADSRVQHATAQDLASKYQISVDTVRRKVQDGSWPCVRIGRLYRFSPEHQAEIDRLIESPPRSPLNRSWIAKALQSLANE
jgi:hypothetical protein